jgi:hypothetical protein
VLGNTAVRRHELLLPEASSLEGGKGKGSRVAVKRKASFRLS